MRRSNFTRFWCGWSKWTWFQCGRLNLTAGSELIWFSRGGRKILGLLSGSKLNWFLRRSIEIDFMLVRIELSRFMGRPGYGCSPDVPWRPQISVVASKLNSFCVGDRIWLRSGVGIEIDTAGGRNRLCAGRNWLVFRVVIDWLGFCVGARNWLDFWMRAANLFVLVWSPKLTCFLCGWSKLTRFQCGGSILYKRAKEVLDSNPSQRWLSSSVFNPL